MAEISSRAVVTAAGGAVLAVALAWVSNADTSQRQEGALRVSGQTVQKSAATERPPPRRATASPPTR